MIAEGQDKVYRDEKTWCDDSALYPIAPDDGTRSLHSSKELYKDNEESLRKSKLAPGLQPRRPLTDCRKSVQTNDLRRRV